MKKDHINLICSLKLFENCDKEMIKNMIIGNGRILSFRSGEPICDAFSPSIGILLSGRAVIYSSDKGRRMILRFVSPGNAVGVASLFAAEPPRTRIEACGDGKSEMFFIGRDSVEKLLNCNEHFRTNLISFLADRVSFLNSKIDFVTAGSAERKVAVFIKHSPTDSAGVIGVGMSMTALAHALDIGRASLYRALEALENDGIIKRNGKSIILISPEKLDEIL